MNPQVGLKLDEWATVVYICDHAAWCLAAAVLVIAIPVCVARFWWWTSWQRLGQKDER